MTFTKDQLWKGIIEDLFEHFLHYFFPTFVEQIDFRRPFEFLDKELKQLYPESDSKSRRADMLVKVHLKNGEETWILIHIEVQGYVDKMFPKRMFVYNYRSADRFGKDVVAIAILTDENANYHPTHFEKKTWNTTIRYDFQTFKLLNYEESYFDKSNNPFAIVLQVARSHLRNKALKSDEDLLSLKVQLFKKMLEKGHDKQIIRSLTLFIKNFVTFTKQDFLSKFDDEIDTITQKRPSMGLYEMYVQAEKEKSLNQGIEKGIEKGLNQAEVKHTRKLLLKNFSVEEIVDILEFPQELVEQVALELKIEALLKKEKSVEEIIKELKVKKEIILKVQKQKKEKSV